MKDPIRLFRDWWQIVVALLLLKQKWEKLNAIHRLATNLNLLFPIKGSIANNFGVSGIAIPETCHLKLES